MEPIGEDRGVDEGLVPFTEAGFHSLGSVMCKRMVQIDIQAGRITAVLFHLILVTILLFIQDNFQSEGSLAF